jgi:steroid delta-isomerase-like uncharacterized protein
LTLDHTTNRARSKTRTAAAKTDTRSKRMETVLEHMNAENGHEFERCIDAFDHPRYEIIATGEIYDGPTEVARLLDENKRAFPDFHFDVRRMRDADEAVIVEGDFRGTHRGLWRGLPSTGRAVDFPVIIVFEFEGDRMVCERTYFDLGMPLRQLGVARNPNTRSGQIATALNHPVTVGRAVLGELRRRAGVAKPWPVAAGARDNSAHPRGWRPQAIVGSEITNAVSGERLVFLQTHESSQGRLFQAEILMPAGNYVIESHFHPSQVERFEVIAGQLGVRVGNAIQYITAGQDVVVPIRTTHSYWNAGRGELRILYEHRPALVSAEVFFLTYFGLSRVGKLSATGQMNLLQSAVLIRDVGDFIRPPQPPMAIQGPLFAPLALLGDLLGYRPWYPELLDPAGSMS